KWRKRIDTMKHISISSSTNRIVPGMGYQIEDWPQNAMTKGESPQRKTGDSLGDFVAPIAGCFTNTACRGRFPARKRHLQATIDGKRHIHYVRPNPMDPPAGIAVR